MINRSSGYITIIFVLPSFPNKLTNKIPLPKYLIHHHPQVVNLIIVNVNKDNAILAQKVLGKEQTGIQHAEPVAVKVSAILAVLAEQTFLHQVAFFVLVADSFEVVLFLLAESVGVNKAVIACVIRWVNDDALYLAVIGLLQNFQYFEIFTFNENVFCCVKVDGFIRCRLQCGCGWLLQHPEGISLACPIQYIPLIGKVDVITEGGPQLFPIKLFLGKELRKQLF